MTRQVAGLFDTRGDANAALRDLQSMGITNADISVVSSRTRDEHGAADQADGSEAATGAGTGAVGGAVLGGTAGVLVGLGLLTIPGVGPVLAAGPLAAAIGTTGAAAGAGVAGAAAGAAAGGLVGALIGSGIPKEDANVYAEGIRRGGTLVMARVPNNLVDPVIDVMDRNNVVDIDQRRGDLQAAGWSGFDEHGEPYDRSTEGTGTMRERQVGGLHTRPTTSRRARSYDHRDVSGNTGTLDRDPSTTL